MNERRNGPPGTVDQKPRWEGPPENRPRGYLPAIDDPASVPDAAGETLRDPDRDTLGDGLRRGDGATPRQIAPDSRHVLASGRTIPVLGLGTWQLDEDTSGCILRALEAGYRLIDTSGDYGTQAAIGAALRQSGIDRDEIFLVTKVEEDEDAYVATRRNLDELGLDHADLVLLHRPPPEGAGEALWEGLLRARQEGLTRDVGVSNYATPLIDRLIDASGVVPAVNQVEWTPFGHSDALQRHAAARSILLQAYSPLTRMTRLDDPLLAEIADRHGKTPAQIVLRWDLQRGVIPIPKATSVSHQKENRDIFDVFLSDVEMARLDACNERYSALGTLPYE